MTTSNPSAITTDDAMDRLKHLLGRPELLRSTLATLQELAPDAVNKPALEQWLAEGGSLSDGRWDIRVALRAVARIIQPRTYLEIGTRRGWSLAQVLAESPAVRAWCLDLWIPGYGGVQNPGPHFVREEIRRAVPEFRGGLTFLSGNSHALLPGFLGALPHDLDLVTVDGDHTALGAWWDLMDVMPRIAPGGAVVFDDLVDRSDELLGLSAGTDPARRPAPESLTPSLLDVWRHLQREFPDFEYLENLSGIAPVGIALRVR